MVTVEVKGLDVLTQAFSSLPNRISAGVKVTGPASAYALVWEWGSSKLTKPGPKTLWSVNPAGQPAILTQTAPLGYIRVNHQMYIKIIKEEFKKLKLAKTAVSNWKSKLDGMMWKAAVRCATLISDTAPIDEGDLRAGIVAVNEPDPILDGTFNAFGSTEFDISTGWMQ